MRQDHDGDGQPERGSLLHQLRLRGQGERDRDRPRMAVVLERGEGREEQDGPSHLGCDTRHGPRDHHRRREQGRGRKVALRRHEVERRADEDLGQEEPGPRVPGQEPEAGVQRAAQALREALRLRGGDREGGLHLQEGPREEPRQGQVDHRDLSRVALRSVQGQGSAQGR